MRERKRGHIFIFTGCYQIGLIDIIYGTVMINADDTALKFPRKSKGKVSPNVRTNAKKPTNTCRT